MTQIQQIQVVKDFMSNNPDSCIDFQTSSIGNGAWAITVQGINCFDQNDGHGISTDLFTITGSNGTHSSADDLWSDITNIMAAAQ
jgi:hypothetical protein